MKFSGHETFHIREGWLHKGMRLLANDGKLFSDPFAHDRLGVGRNMGKSIKHWLQVTGLAQVDPEGKKLVASELGNLLMECDPYFTEPFSWWVLHVNLVHNAEAATTWHWFFNSFYHARFEKRLCVDTLRRFVVFRRSRAPSWNTLERDVGCLLASYARVVPEDLEADPEESYDCPFQELGLLLHFRETNTYQFAQVRRSAPWEILGYIASATFGGETVGKATTVPLGDAATAINGLGKCLALSASELFDVLESASAVAGEREIAVAGLAASRELRYVYREPCDWVRMYFSRVTGVADVERT